MSIEFDKKVQVNTIIENQLPQFLVADFPNATEFFKQYYLSQEFQGANIDLVDNLDNYLKVDNLVPEVVIGTTNITDDIDASHTTITVESTKGFPDEYGLLKIDDEIITYTSKTDINFFGCVRGFSGISNLSGSTTLESVNKQDLVFEKTQSAAHTAGSSVTNLSVLFLQEFYQKLKKTFLPGLEDNEFVDGLDVGNFIKNARSFYQSKGIAESIRILFKVLYGEHADILDLEERLLKPSTAEYIRREVVIAEAISGDPANLVGQTITKSTDSQTSASVSEVEIFERNLGIGANIRKTYYKISLFVGFSDRDLIEGIFTIPGKTKVLEPVAVGSDVISVDSTIGFPNSGTVISGNNTITYTSKTVNQFFGCSGVVSTIHDADDLRADEVVFGYENADISKKVELRITGVLSDFVISGNVNLIKEGEKIYSKNMGESIPSYNVSNVDDSNRTYKQIFANSWKYNTSSRYQVDSWPVNGNPSLLSPIDKSSLAIGDNIEIFDRFGLDSVGSAVISNIDESDNTLTGLDNLIWTRPDDPHPDRNYDIRRIIKKSKLETTVNSDDLVSFGNSNEKFIADVLNVYVDGDTDGYVTSNSLPSYGVDAEYIRKSFETGNANTLELPQTTDPIDPSIAIDYIQIKFDSPTVFSDGDAVVYEAYDKTTGAAADTLVGITTLNPDGTTRVFYLDVSADKQSIRLHDSVGAIGISTIVLNKAPSFVNTGVIHRFTSASVYNRTLTNNPILRKFPLSQDLNIAERGEKTENNVGVLIDGVEIKAATSLDFVKYGQISSVDIFNGGEGYDVCNPPKIKIEDPTVSTATTALAEPVVTGSVQEVIVETQNFDIDECRSVSLVGGNGKGCLLEPEVGPRFRQMKFDSQDSLFNGGVDPVNEVIRFIDTHGLRDGERIFYNSNGNDPIGIGAFQSGATTVSDYLVNGAPYYVNVLNDKNIRLFNTPEDALTGSTGINTIGFSTTSNGIHIFRTEPRNTLRSVKVVNSGSGYSYKKVIVPPVGISTSYDLVQFENHGFKEGDIVKYDTMEYDGSSDPIAELNTTSEYRVVKIDDNAFRLSDGADDYKRGKYVNLTSTGTGYNVFKYPDITVTASVTYKSNKAVGTINFTPIVTGTITGIDLYEKGNKYGSEVINHNRDPEGYVQSGKEAELKAIVSDGRIIDVYVLNKGKEYYSLPEIKLTGSGTGAKFKPVVSDGKLTEVVVINEGIGYSQSDTFIVAESRGKNGLIKPRISNFNVDIASRRSNFHLEPYGDDKLVLSAYSYGGKVATAFDGLGSGGHSPIIGWAYDGVPIYGPNGFSEPDKFGSTIKRMVSGYSKDSVKIAADIAAGIRPSLSKFPEGSLIQDWEYSSDKDLDDHNGRFCKTPEFPKGIYAYFATIDENLDPVYPYFIGKTYRLPYITGNNVLNQEFDFNSTTLSRNTFPYKVDDKFADNDFIIESNEIVRQMSTVESVTRGSVSEFEILDGGDGYKVGDFTVFDNTETNGTGARGQVDEIVGIGVSSIETELTKFENVVFEWGNNSTVFAHLYPHVSLNDQDTVIVSGLSTTNVALTNSFTIGIKTDTMTLVKEIPQNTNPNGTVEDIYVNFISDVVSIGSSIKIEDEYLKVLNLYPVGSIIRVKRFGTGNVVSYGSTIDALASKISIPAKSERFESTLNKVVYFNGPKSVGIGTTSGSFIDYSIGENNNQVPVPVQQIYVPNHPFKTGDKVSFRKDITSAPAATSLLVSPKNDGSDIVNMPDINSGKTDVYVINKGTDYIGLATNAGAAHTTGGLYFYGNGSDSYEYSFTTNYDQVDGDISRITSTVITKVAAANTSTHGLKDGDIVNFNVVPNHVVGYGNTFEVDVRYNSEYEKLLFNPLDFGVSGISTSGDDINPNTFTILNHGFNTGDKVFYDSDEIIWDTPSNTGFTTGSYFVHKLDSNTFYLAETLKDSQSVPAKIIGIATEGGLTAEHTIASINPKIEVVKNSQLTFGLSTSSLSGFDFDIYYDKEFKNKFVNSGDSTDFNVVKGGEIGNEVVGAALTIRVSKSLPSKLFYSLEKSGYISTADKDVPNYSEISFVDSLYNGEYEIFDVTDDEFKFSPRREPELLKYDDHDCDKLEYSTKSSDVIGPIKGLKTISTGFGYKRVPKFSHVASENGRNANIVAISTSIGNINQIRINDIGFEYSADKTLRPEASISPVITIDNLDQVSSVNIVSGGLNYLSAPKLLLFNPNTNQVVDSDSFVAIVPEQSIAKVEIAAPVKGLESVNHRLIAIDNSNGVGINSISVENDTTVVCRLTTPLNGFRTPPFAIGDEIFVEGIQRVGEAGIGVSNTGQTATTVEGDGFNSSDYNYQFFTVSEYLSSNPDVLKFDLVGVTTNPGVAKVFQSGYANIVNRKVYPELEVIQDRAEFSDNESILVQESGSYIKKDIRIVEYRDDYIKTDGYDRLKVGDRFIGNVSGTAANVTGITNSKAKFNVDFSSRVDYGWNDNIGKLNEDFQVIPNNDYYQNLSYSVKSPITWDKFVDPLNRVIHPAGLKNFADTVIQDTASFVGVGTTQPAVADITIDVIEEKRVDVINNFDLAIDYDALDDRSKFIEFQNVKLTDYTKCLTNRVLIHDDISDRFSSAGIGENYTEIEEINGNYVKYLVQITDPDSFDVQLSDLVVLTTTNNAFLLEKTSDYSGHLLGDFSADSSDAERKTLLFTPTDKFDTDHDIKVLKTSFSTDVAGIGTESFGSVKLVGDNVSVGSATTTVSSTISGTVQNDDLVLTVTDYDLNSTDAGYDKVIPNLIGSYLSVWETKSSSAGLYEVGFAVTAITSSTTADLVPVQKTTTLVQDPNTGVITIKNDFIKILPSSTITYSTDYTVASDIGFLDNTDIQSIVLGVTTTTLYKIDEDDFNGLCADFVIQDDFSRDLNYNEVLLNIDHVTDELQLVESYTDTTVNEDGMPLSYSANTIGILTATHDGNYVNVNIVNDRNRTLSAGVNVVGLGTTTAGIGTYRFNVTGQPIGAERSARLESTYSGEAGISTVTRLSSEIDSSLKSLIRVSCGDTTVLHQVILMQDKDSDAAVVEYPYISNDYVSGIGTFGVSNPDAGVVSFNFYPDDGTNGTLDYTSSIVEVQAFNTIFQTVNDFENESDILEYGPIVSDLVLSAYDGPNGDRANKVNFELKHEGTPIYYKRFNPSDTSQLDLATGKFTLSNHFFNTNEELTYTPYSTFIGVPATAPGIASTEGIDGTVINTLPETVYVKAVSGDEFFLYSKKEYIASGDPITFTNSGSGNAHKFQMSKVLSKTVIGLDGIVQQPISYTAVEHSLQDDVGFDSVGVAVTQFALSGISSIQPRDVLKIGNEYMKVIEVGLAESAEQVPDPVTGKLPAIGSEKGTIPVVNVKRGTLGMPAQSHSAGDEARVHRGSFNIVDSTIWFLDPPKGNTRQRRSETNLPYVKAEYNGRTFLRTNYDTNMVFDDISDSFTGIGRTYTLTVGGANTLTGVGVGNGVLFINGVFQTPLTLNNLGNNYEFESDTNVGISSVMFTGITSENGSRIQSEYDINQNQIPRGGLINTLGSKAGLGYAPLVGARVKAEKTAGIITSLVGVAHSSLNNINIVDAEYDNNSGIITVTTDNPHYFSLDNPSTVLLNQLEFECSSAYAGVTTTVFNDDNRSIPVVAITSERTFEAFCGISTIDHNYVHGGTYYNGGYVCEFYEDLTFGSGYREPVSIGVTDIAYEHRFVSAASNAVVKNTGGITGGTQYQPTGAEYESHTGRLLLDVGYHTLEAATAYDIDSAAYSATTGKLTITKAGHDFVVGDWVKIVDYGISFKCSMDNYGSIHPYPRPTDPISGKWVQVTNKTANTFKVEVGTSPIVKFTPTTGTTYDPNTGLMVLEIGTHTLTVGTSIKIAEEGLKFSCGFGGATGTAAEKSYPRSNGNDPFYDSAFEIVDITETSITVQVLTTIPSTNVDPHTFVDAVADCVETGGDYTHQYASHLDGCILKAKDTVILNNDTLTFTCSRDDHYSKHTYPRATDPASGTTLGIDAVSDDTIIINVGPGGGAGFGANVTAKIAENDHKYVSSSAMGLTANAGGPFTINDADYDPQTGIMTVTTSATHSFVAADVTGISTASYDPTTGIVTLETASAHGFSNGDYIKIAEKSLLFTCAQDEDSTKHAYPRKTDPIHNKWIQISNITSTTFDIQCLLNTPSTNTTVHKLYSAEPNNIQRANNTVEFAQECIVFTCNKDRHATTHAYPRISDPIFGLPVGVETIVNATTFTINVGKSPAGTGGSLEFDIINGGANYVNPEIITPDPVYQNMPIEGISRLALGETKETGVNLLLDIDVDTTSAPGVSTSLTPTSASYNPSTGILGLTFDSTHLTDSEFKNGDMITIADNSLSFRCDMGSNEIKTYPRPGLDPACRQDLKVTNLSSTGFDVQIGRSPIVTYDVSNATYNGSNGKLVLTIGANHGLKKGSTLKLADESIAFTCTAPTGTHTYTGGTVTNAITITAGNVQKDVTDASYDPTTGLLVLTIGSHSFTTSDTVTIGAGKIIFSCDADNHATNHSYPRSGDPAYNTARPITAVDTSGGTITVDVGIANPTGNTKSYPRTTIDTHTAQAGTTYEPATGVLTVVTTSDHNMKDGDWVKIADNAISFICEYGVGEHIYDGGTATDVLTITPVGAPFDQTKSVTWADYDHLTGDLVLTIGTHNYSVGDAVKIADNGLSFTCSADSHQTSHTYPRAVAADGQPDPAYNTSLNITAVDTTGGKITVNVGDVSDASRTKSYPRSTDGISGKWIKVFSASGSTFKIDVLQGDISTNNSTHTFAGCVANAISQKRDRAYDAPIEVISANQSAGTITLQVGKTGNLNAHTFDAGSTTAGAVISGGNYNHTFVKSDSGSITRGFNQNNELFGIKNFQVARQGHSFAIGDRMKVVGLVTSALVHEPIQEFELNVASTSNDYFAAWQFGEIDFIDDIRFLQDGIRTRFPIFLNGQLLSFEKDETDPLSAQIDLNAVLLIFVNGVIQTPNWAYQFFGGTSFTFTEPPDTNDKVDIFFFKGQDGVDIKIVDIDETIKVGDQLQLKKHNGLKDTRSQFKPRTVKELLSSDLVETEVYRGPGINENDFKPVDWLKQKQDTFINGEKISKTRDSIEPQIYPTAKIIGDVTTTTVGKDGVDYGIFVDDAQSFHYEDLGNPNIDPGDRYNITVDQVDAIIYSPENNDLQSANITANVSNDGTVSSLTIVDGGSGYNGSVTLSIGAPIGVGVGTINREEYEVAGTSEFAKATATVTNGTITDTLVTDIGKGYSSTNPPQVNVSLDATEFEKVTKITNVQGWSAIITGIAVTDGTNGNDALKFEFQVESNQLASDLLVGYPVLIHDTQLGDGVISIDADDASVVGVGTTFLDNVYKVHQITGTQRTGVITCNVSSTSAIAGIAQTGQYDQTNLGITTSLGRISWGRLYNPLDGVVRDENPLNLVVSGKTVNVGLSSFPTIQRRTYDPASHKGLRNTGAIRTIG